MKGHMQDGKFHPHTDYKKGVRKSRDQSRKLEGVKIRKQRIDARPKITKHISPRLIKNIEELSRTLSDDNLSGGLRGTRYNGTMAFWSQLKRETDMVSELIKEENLENEVVTAVPPEVVKETLRMKRDSIERKARDIGSIDQITDEVEVDFEKSLKNYDFKKKKLRNIVWVVSIIPEGGFSEEYFAFHAKPKDESFKGVTYRTFLSNFDWSEGLEEELLKKMESDDTLSQKLYDEWLVGAFEAYTDAFFEGLIDTIEDENQ